MSVILGIILLGIIVFLHELGHFTASKLCGIKVESFSIGMGPILFHKEFCGTDFRISLLPFGGYCGMRGEKDIDEVEFSKLPLDSFYGKKPIFRAIIGFAGPFANFISAIIAFSVSAMIGYTYYSLEPKVQIASEIYENVQSSAYEAGMRTGDKILKINNEELSDFTDIPKLLSTHPNEDVKILVERNNENLTFTVHTNEAGKIGIMSMKVESEKYGFFRAFAKGTKETFEMTKNYIKAILSLFNMKSSEIAESMSGPARITTLLGDSTKYGFSTMLNLLGFINIALFVMNLLPIPVLDGWLIFISIIESIFKIRVPGKIFKIAQIIGISLMVILFVIATTSDIKYFIGALNVKN